ncbi:MAG: MlaD family protein [Longimicrobiales bacterium]
MPTPVKRDRGFGRQLRVVALLVVGLTLISLAVYQVGKIFNVFASQYTLVTLAPSAAGLREGAQVTLAGQLVGQVAAVEFIPVTRPRGANNVSIHVSVDEAVREQIRSDSRAFIRSQGLLGDKYIDIAPGSPTMPVLASGDTLPSAEVVDLESVLATAATTMVEAQAVIEEVRGITAAITRGEGTLGQLVVDDVLYQRLAGVTGELALLLQSMNRSDGTLGRLIHDPVLYERTSMTIARLDTLTNEALHADGTIGRMLRDDALYDQALGTVAGLDSALVNASALLARVNDGDGTLQRLVADPGLYDQLLKAVVDLQTLILDIRQNPDKYKPNIRVDVFE